MMLTKLPWITSLIAGFVHLLAIFALAALISIETNAAEGWVYAMWLDFPAYLLTLPILSFIPGDTDSFHFCLLWFSVIGTIQWMIIGWIAGRVIVAVQKSLQAGHPDR